MEEFIHIYETKVNKSQLPVEKSVLDLLKRSLTTSTDMPAYKNLIENILPEATRLKLAMFEKHDLDTLVFPYQTSFASPISNPAFGIKDPTFVPSTRPQPSIFAPYSSVGFPAIVVPMGFGSQGLPMTISAVGPRCRAGPPLTDHDRGSDLALPWSGPLSVGGIPVEQNGTFLAGFAESFLPICSRNRMPASY